MKVFFRNFAKPGIVFHKNNEQDKSSRRHITESAWSWPEVPPPFAHVTVDRRRQGSHQYLSVSITCSPH